MTIQSAPSIIWLCRLGVKLQCSHFKRIPGFCKTKLWGKFLDPQESDFILALDNFLHCSGVEINDTVMSTLKAKKEPSPSVKCNQSWVQTGPFWFSSMLCWQFWRALERGFQVKSSLYHLRAVSILKVTPITTRHLVVPGNLCCGWVMGCLVRWNQEWKESSCLDGNHEQLVKRDCHRARGGGRAHSST